MILQPLGMIGAPSPWLNGEQEVVERVRLVLETRPGRLPWRPEFGCDLDGFVGQPATSARMREVQWCIEQAITRWVPDIQVQRCEVRISAVDGLGVPHPTTPRAESALLSLGAQATLEVSLDLRTSTGTLNLHASLTP